MTPEEKSLLERTYKMTLENNELLRHMRRAARWASVMRYIYWIIIIVLSFGAYYFIQPYIDFLTSTLSGLHGSNGSSDSMLQTLQSLMK